jgi:hypothetical protein
MDSKLYCKFYFRLGDFYEKNGFWFFTRKGNSMF